MKLSICLLVLIATLALTAEAAPGKKDKKKAPEHPGCMVWWFLDGCPLGNMFGADPFNIYPWNKFCIKYPEAFEGLEQCQEFVKTEIEEAAEEIEKVTEEEIVEENELKEEIIEMEEVAVARSGRILKELSEKLLSTMGSKMAKLGGGATTVVQQGATKMKGVHSVVQKGATKLTSAAGMLAKIAKKA